MQDVKHGQALSLSSIALLVILGTQVCAQELPKDITIDDLAKNNKLFIDLATKALHWDEPTDPVHIVGPLSFKGYRRWVASKRRAFEDKVDVEMGVQKSQ